MVSCLETKARAKNHKTKNTFVCMKLDALNGCTRDQQSSKKKNKRNEIEKNSASPSMVNAHQKKKEKTKSRK